MKSSLSARLEELLGPDQTDTASGSLVALPRDIDTLAETMRLISAARGKATILGGGTLPAPVALDETVTISLANLGGVSEVNPGDFLLVAGAGTPADDVVSAARTERLHLPLDITSGARATVGGAYMTGAVGPYSAGYGPFRDYVLGAKCVTARGDIVTFGGRTMKNVTGYEITRFLAGTRGIFAIAAELILKALPLPERRTVLVGRFRESGDIAEILPAIETASNVVKTAELVAENGFGGETVLAVGLEGMAPMVEKGIGVVRTLLEKAGAESEREESPEEFARFRREASQRLVESGILTLQAPPSASPALLRGIREVSPEIPAVAHPLVGRFHVVAGAPESEALARKVLAVGGKHPAPWNAIVRNGLKDFFTPAELAVARSLKRELDPEGVLNPHLRLG